MSPRPREKGDLRKKYNIIIWKFLKAHPELADLGDTKRLTRIGNILDKVRKQAYPFIRIIEESGRIEKRKGWEYQAWCREIWTFYDNWIEMNLEWALWAKNPQKIKPQDNRWD